MRRVAAVTVAVCLLFSSPALIERWRLEQRPGPVMIAIDGASFATLAAHSGIAGAEWWRDLAAAGATAVAVAPLRVADAARYGVSVYSAREIFGLAAAGTLPPTWRAALASGLPLDASWLVWREDIVPPWLAQDLHADLEPSAAGETHDGAENIWTFRMQADQLAAIPLGFAPDTLHEIAASGLRVAPRLTNASRYRRPGALGYDLERLRGAPLGPLIAEGVSVPGWPDALHETAAVLASWELPVGRVEFAEQKGVGEWARLDVKVVRVHSITARELPRYAPATAVQRFDLAVRERGARVLYVRALAGDEADPAAANLAYVRTLAASVRAAGFELGAPQPLPSMGHARWQQGAFFAAAAGAWLLFIFALRAVVVLPEWLAALLTAALWAATAALDAKGYTLATRAATAWVAAVSGPVATLAWAIRTPKATDPRLRAALLRGLGAAAILTAAIGFEVTALADDRFLSGLAAFHGVKALLLLPPIWVALIALDPARRPAAWLGRARVALAVGARTPVTWGALAFAAAAAAAVYVYLWRSGNTGATFPFEDWVRQHLQDLLGVRPRTKEWLLGVPALVLALTGQGGRWRPALWAAAAVGCASVSDTFAHAHAPLAVSLLRSAYGWGIGGALGLIMAGLLRRSRR